MFRGVVKDIFFDLDHTLWDFEKNSELTFQKIFDDNGLKLQVLDFLAVYAPINREYWRQYREGNLHKDDLRYLRLKTTFDQLGLPVTDDMIFKLSDDYIDCLCTFTHVLPGTMELLDYLKGKYRLHIITNGFQEVQDKKIRNANLQDYFEHVFDSEMAGAKKPDPKIFQLALDITGAKPETSLMIGDDLEADVLGAMAMGLHAIHLDVERSQRHGYCGIVGHLEEIKSLL